MHYRVLRNRGRLAPRSVQRHAWLRTCCARLMLGYIPVRSLVFVLTTLSGASGFHVQLDVCPAVVQHGTRCFHERCSHVQLASTARENLWRAKMSISLWAEPLTG